MSPSRSHRHHHWRRVVWSPQLRDDPAHVDALRVEALSWRSRLGFLFGRESASFGDCIARRIDLSAERDVLREGGREVETSDGSQLEALVDAGIPYATVPER